MDPQNRWTAPQTIVVDIPRTAHDVRTRSPKGAAERRPVQSSFRDSTKVGYPNAEGLCPFGVFETEGGRDSALRCPRAVQARNGCGKIYISFVPPLAAAVTAQRAVPTPAQDSCVQLSRRSF